jgi:hypothetical protein
VYISVFHIKCRAKSVVVGYSINIPIQVQYKNLNFNFYTEQCMYIVLLNVRYLYKYDFGDDVGSLGHNARYRRKQFCIAGGGGGISQGRLLGHYFPLKLYRLSLVYKLLGGDPPSPSPLSMALHECNAYLA